MDDAEVAREVTCLRSVVLRETMLLGEFHCTADSRGKLRLPAEFRAELSGGLTLTRGIEGCLFVYPAEAWRKLAQEMQARLPLTSRDARSFARLMFSGALTCVPDQRGRIPLPDNLRRYAAIEDQVTVIGLYTHLEVWSPQRWQEAKDQVLREGMAIAEELSHLGI